MESAGHQIVTPRQAGLSGRDDVVHFRHAIAHGLVLLTKNPNDFAQLHADNPEHCGLLLIYQDNDPDRDMSHAEVIRAYCDGRHTNSNSKHSLLTLIYEP